MARNLKTAQFSLIALTCLASMLLCGCSTLSSLGIPVGSPGNKLLNRAKAISEVPGQGILTQKELAIAPMASYAVEIADTISVEPVSFDASIRLPGDQVVKPDGSISLGEFGAYQANGKTVEQMKLEIQAQIDEQLRSAMEIEFAKEEARRIASENLDSGTVVDTEFDSEEGSDSQLELDREDEMAERARARNAKQEKSQRIEARREFERRLDEKLLQNKISVRVTNWESKKIYVLGDVNSPGSFVYIGNETVLDAIIEAGGLGSRANHHNIIVSRPSRCGDCRTVMKVCYDQIVQLGDTSTNYQLMPGDRVFVPSMTFMDDVKQTLNPKFGQTCPRCSGCDQGCNLPSGCGL
jgi:polysaccharide export outer membrane protein